MSGRWANCGTSAPHRLEQQDVLGRVRQVVLAADDVADLHVRVVDADREVVERRAVRADDDQVAAERRLVDLDVAADDVVERDDSLPDAEANDRLATLRLARGTLLGSQPRAAADVVRWLMGGLLGGLVGGQLLLRAVAVVGLVLGQELGRRPRDSGRGAASGDTARTGPRAGRPATSGPSSHSMPSQCSLSRMSLLELERGARHVRVLEAEDERAAHAFREQVVEQRRPGRADMQRAGRARRDADADAHRCPTRHGPPRAAAIPARDEVAQRASRRQTAATSSIDSGSGAASEGR